MFLWANVLNCGILHDGKSSRENADFPASDNLWDASNDFVITISLLFSLLCLAFTASRFLSAHHFCVCLYTSPHIWSFLMITAKRRAHKSVISSNNCHIIHMNAHITGARFRVPWAWSWERRFVCGLRNSPITKKSTTFLYLQARRRKVPFVKSYASIFSVRHTRSKIQRANIHSARGEEGRERAECFRSC